MTPQQIPCTHCGRLVVRRMRKKLICCDQCKERHAAEAQARRSRREKAMRAGRPVDPADALREHHFRREVPAVEAAYAEWEALAATPILRETPHDVRVEIYVARVRLGWGRLNVAFDAARD